MAEDTRVSSGGCLCGGIRYRFTGEPRVQVLCSCRDCQRANGGAYIVGLLVRKDNLTIDGEPARHAVKSAGGSEITREFCPDCGSQLFNTQERLPRYHAVMAGTLDDPSWVQPQIHVWTRSELPWAHQGETIKRFEQGAE